MNLDAVNPELESKINDLVCEAYNKSFLEQEKLLKEAFELIPKPVTQWAHPTTMVAIALFDLYYKNQKYEQAEKWLTIALSVADLGTTNAGTYLLGGLFYYDIEKYDDAYKYFDIAYNDAGYYPFSIEDKKYWEFYKQRKEELNPKNLSGLEYLLLSEYKLCSYKLPPPTAAYGCCLPKSILANGDLTAVYGRDGKKLAVSPTATISWSITGTSETVCTRFTRKVKNV